MEDELVMKITKLLYPVMCSSDDKIAADMARDYTDDILDLIRSAGYVQQWKECPECGGVGTHTWNATKYDYPATTCSRCNGTGKSDLPVIAEVCPDQTLPRYNHPSGEACYAVATAQQDMITPYEENGRVVKWVKCYVE